jgi:hypothetical protein
LVAQLWAGLAALLYGLILGPAKQLASKGGSSNCFLRLIRILLSITITATAKEGEWRPFDLEGHSVLKRLRASPSIAAFGDEGDLQAFLQ